MRETVQQYKRTATNFIVLTTGKMNSTTKVPKTFLNYLCQLPSGILNKLYESAAACIGIYRYLPSVAQQIVMRLSLVSSGTTIVDIEGWMVDEKKNILHESLKYLRQLHLLQECNLSSIESVVLHRVFAKNLRLALLCNDTICFKTVTVDPKHQKSFADLDSYASEPLPSAQSEKSVSVETKRVLQDSELIQSCDSKMQLTSDGFQFILYDRQQQLWTYLLHYLAQLEKKGSPVHDCIMLILQACLGSHSAAYSTENLSEAALNFIQHLREIGLVHQRKRSAGWFYYTPLISVLTGLKSSSSSSKEGFLIVETNFRVYCYTDSVLDLAIVSTFCEPLYRFPNLVACILNRESVRRAFQVNISAEQIIQYLFANAHKNMQKQTPAIPSTVTDQLKLWEMERDRFKFDPGVMYSNFFSDTDYITVRDYAKDLGVLLCEHEANRALVVSADGHEQSNQFLTLFTSDSKKHTTNLVSVSEVANDQLKQHDEKSTHCCSVSLRFFISSLSAACKSSSYQPIRKLSDNCSDRSNSVSVVNAILQSIAGWLIDASDSVLRMADTAVIEALRKPSKFRNLKEVQLVYFFLRRLDVFRGVGDQTLRTICQSARYEQFQQAGKFLYKSGQRSFCWYILLSGAVFCDGRIYLPIESFGKRVRFSEHRISDCVLLESSEMIVIDYNSTDPSTGPSVGSFPETRQQLPMTSSAGTTMALVNRVSVGDAEPTTTTSPSSSSSSPPVCSSKMVLCRPVHQSIASTSFATSFKKACTIGEQASCSVDEVEISTVAEHPSNLLPNRRLSSQQQHQHRHVSSTMAMVRRSNSIRSSGSSSAGGRVSGFKPIAIPSTSSTTMSDDDFSGLPEISVDSDDEDDDEAEEDDDEEEEEEEEGCCLYAQSSSFTGHMRDLVRECLEKLPTERTDDDIAILLDFVQHMSSFASLPIYVKCELCRKMVFAVVDKAGTIVMKHGEQLDSWSVIINGEVEVVFPDGHRYEYHIGDCFGVQPTEEVQFHQGEMRTLIDDCQFVLVAQADYVQIISKLSDSYTRQLDSAGQVVCEKEKRAFESRVGYVLTKAKPCKLISALFEDRRDCVVDPHFVEDFLLTYRTFVDNPAEVLEKILACFSEPSKREKVARLVLLWVNNHFGDFESNAEMTNLLEKFDKMLEDEAMFNHQQLLNIACSVKSRTRNVTYTRSNRDEVLHFSILGGTEKNNGIYVVKVAAGSAAERVGLKRGDQIIEVNGHNFRNIARHRALEVLRGSTHLSMVVKSNLLGFKEMLVADQCDAGALLAPVLLQQTVVTKDASSRRRMSPVQPRRSLVQLHQLGGVDGLQMPSLRPPPRQPKHSLHLETQRAVMPALVHALANSTAGSSSSRTLTRLNQAGKESGGSGSRLGKLIKKLRQGSSSSALSLDAEDRDDDEENDNVDGHEPRADGGGRKSGKQKSNRQALDDYDVTDEAAVRRATLGRPTGAQSVSMPSGVPLLSRRLKHSRSNPDLSSTANQTIVSGFGQMISQYYEPVRPQHPEHILKVYRIDQTFKYLSVYKETSAQNVVQLALQEFGMCNHNSGGNDTLHSSSSNNNNNSSSSSTTANGGEWSLCEVTVTTDGLIKQRRLPAQMQNLAERISLNSRYYLKNNNCSLPLVPDELAPDLLKDAQAQLGSLHASIVAAQLTLQDFAAFASIEPAEYVDNLFKLGVGQTRWPRLADFEQSVNRETFWVATEVCKERNSIRRAKIIKKFIKIANHCRDFKNFNSMFAIISGLEKPCVRRLHNTWDKISSKYMKMLDNLQSLLDPSRNMSKYRQHLADTSNDPPVIPLLPVLKKDLTFLHECNPTWCDGGMVNFEKLRMVAKEIRFVTKLASAPYELSSMFERSGNQAQLNDALLHMNTFEGGSSVATMKKQHIQHRVPLSRKKLYEQALMVRRVKFYLTQFEPISDESVLDKLSVELEPMTVTSSGGGGGGGVYTSTGNLGVMTVASAGAKRSQPSPSLSSGSSMSMTSSDCSRRCNGPKFGVESPHAVQKILSLVDHSRVRASSNNTRAGSIGSPPTSPCAPLKTVRPVTAAAISHSLLHFGSNNHHHHHQHQHHQHQHGRFNNNDLNTFAIPPPLSSVVPVDLTCESSAVTSSITPSRLHGSASATSSTDSVISHQSDLLPLSSSSSSYIPHAISCDSTDSGHGSLDSPSMITGVGVASSSSSSSPPSQRQSYPPRPSTIALKAASNSTTPYDLYSTATGVVVSTKPLRSFEKAQQQQQQQQQQQNLRFTAAVASSSLNTHQHENRANNVASSTQSFVKQSQPLSTLTIGSRRLATTAEQSHSDTSNGATQVSRHWASVPVAAAVLKMLHMEFVLSRKQNQASKRRRRRSKLSHTVKSVLVKHQTVFLSKVVINQREPSFSLVIGTTSAPDVTSIFPERGSIENGPWQYFSCVAFVHVVNGDRITGATGVTGFVLKTVAIVVVCFAGSLPSTRSVNGAILKASGVIGQSGMDTVDESYQIFKVSASFMAA
ncbi:Rap guanine nucleotide exchange factor [Trichinella papuae]|uniref:General transcription factor IIH subunit 4 n=1 Tax=Trichinella papuae TaxID=268474 RepID=A0A0V1MKG1_9BILA|nr:Rap guanine nucleotide exchange factor [Trichinella papuae]